MVSKEERQMNKDLNLRARQKEIEGWQQYNVFKEMKRDQVPNGAKIIKTIFIETWKYLVNGSRTIKARLVVIGNQDPEKGVISTFAPTVSREIIMMTITLMISNGWDLHSMDVEKAFLQSKSLRREVFIQPPAESAADSDVIWGLQKAAHGLGEPAREWYETLSKTLKGLGLLKSKNDPALFYYKTNDVLKGMMAIHVEDFLFEGYADSHKIVKQLKNRVLI